jgi:serine protease Do
MGNSGGPLVNVDGQVVGMNTAIYSPTGGSNGIGFAIRGSQVKLIENLLITKGKVVRSMLGIIPTEVKEYERDENSLLSGGGARVGDVLGEPAKSAGFKKDDVIIKIGSTDIHNQTDLRNAMLVYAPGSTVPIDYLRNGKKESVDVKLLEYKAPPAEATPRSLGGNGRQFGNPFEGNPFQGNPFQGIPQLGNPFNDQQGDGDSTQPSTPRTGPVHLGVQVGNADSNSRQQFGIPSSVQGAVVVGVVPGSVAESIGMQPGDVVSTFNGKAVTNAQDLTDAVKSIKWGAVAHIVFTHYGDNGEAIKTDRDVKF